MKTLAINTSSSIQWKQLSSLLALHASIIIGWIAYYHYQPELLNTFHLQQFQTPLLWAQSIIVVITPLIAGKIGDYYREKIGNRLRIITVGISFAAMIFMAVAFTIYSKPGEAFLWILPMLIVLWLFAMSLFTSPAISTVELFVPEQKLPRAVAVITIVSDMLYSLEPVITDIINYLGAVFTFVLGGVIVSISGYLLRRNSLNFFKQGAEPVEAVYHTKTKYMSILYIGLGLGVISGILFDLLPTWLAPIVPDNAPVNVQWLISFTLILSAILSFPASKWVENKEKSLVLWVGFPALLLLSGGFYFIPNYFMTIVMLALFALGYAVVNVSALPLAIQYTGMKEKVFGVGLFFCGLEIPNSILDILTH